MGCGVQVDWEMLGLVVLLIFVLLCVLWQSIAWQVSVLQICGLTGQLLFLSAVVIRIHHPHATCLVL